MPAVGRRQVQNIITQITGNAAFQKLSSEDQSLMLNLAKAAENGTVTYYINQVGYSKVFAVVEHISSPFETHVFLHYMSTHIAAELHHDNHNGPVLG
ncbi:uncharacterized protein [Argopecten irradians]|uniref:uncharacterized protein n=1 Tax=Argopecten irradians TaxID=31199 RepID=UPI0037217696